MLPLAGDSAWPPVDSLTSPDAHIGLHNQACPLAFAETNIIHHYTMYNQKNSKNTLCTGLDTEQLHFLIYVFYRHTKSFNTFSNQIF